MVTWDRKLTALIAAAGILGGLISAVFVAGIRFGGVETRVSDLENTVGELRQAPSVKGPMCDKLLASYIRMVEAGPINGIEADQLDKKLERYDCPRLAVDRAQ